MILEVTSSSFKKAINKFSAWSCLSLDRQEFIANAAGYSSHFQTWIPVFREIVYRLRHRVLATRRCIRGNTAFNLPAASPRSESWRLA
mmetsp:Transcript_9913/g.18357  ORF Transcript_9913/g.18357 Transcript_9913/m.18357 type:complete len:88 (+) Transcript_9913:61-324(+)